MFEKERILSSLSVPKYRGVMLKAVFCAFMILFQSTVALPKVSSLQLKAMFLEAALRFITWPDSSAHKENFVVGVNENDRIVAYIEDVMSSKKINGRKVRFVHLNSSYDVGDCDMVFISELSEKNLEKVLDKTRNRSVLTVTDSPELTYKGIMMSIVVENRKIRCYINKLEAAKSKLEISHHLLRKSKIISTEGERE